MAITKIHAIKSTLGKALAYIENPDKTDGQMLVSGYNCEPQTASIDFEMTTVLAHKARNLKRKRSTNLAYHLIQSFSPEDAVAPEQAHELGKKLAFEYTGGKYEYVVATHIDKGHIHNLGKTQIGLTNELAEVKQKRTTYAAAAKHLQICKTYKPVWMEYAAKPLNQKMEYFNHHSTELQAYRNAAAYLEKEGIDQSVEIDKVNVLAQEMGHRMDELMEQLRDVNLQEQKVRQERQTFAEIQSDLVE